MLVHEDFVPVMLIGSAFSLNCRSLGVHVSPQVTGVNSALGTLQLVCSGVEGISDKFLWLGPCLPSLWGEFAGDDDGFLLIDGNMHVSEPVCATAVYCCLLLLSHSTERVSPVSFGKPLSPVCYQQHSQ